MTLNLYNSAGERVRQLYAGPGRGADALRRLADGPNGEIELGGFDTGVLQSLAWDGTNDAGQAVDNGSYYAKLSLIDPFGDEQVYSLPLVLAGQGAVSQLDVFNSAGERVRHLALPEGLEISDVDASAKSFVAGPGNSGLALQVKTGSGDRLLLWDGLNDAGQLLSPGNYLVLLSRAEPGGARTLKSVPVLLLRAGEASVQTSLASAILGPDPWRGDGPLQVRWAPPARGQAVVQLYRLDGLRLPCPMNAGAAPGSLELRPTLAEGVYWVELRVQLGSAILGRRLFKLAVVR